MSNPVNGMGVKTMTSKRNLGPSKEAGGQVVNKLEPTGLTWNGTRRRLKKETSDAVTGAMRKRTKRALQQVVQQVSHRRVKVRRGAASAVASNTSRRKSSFGVAQSTVTRNYCKTEHSDSSG
jgi:U3 small nucleolar ribonucleoprotein component